MRCSLARTGSSPAARRRKPKLRVSWHGSESVIGVLDRHALTRLEQRLSGRGAS